MHDANCIYEKINGGWYCTTHESYNEDLSDEYRLESEVEEIEKYEDSIFAY